MDYCWDIDIDKMFNKHKIKYVILDKLIEFKENSKRNAYFFIDFDYFMKKFLYFIDYYNNKDMIIDNNLINQFLVGILNIIAHYKNYFYNKQDCISFYYIFINNKKYKNNKQLNNLVKCINKILLMIPRIYNIYFESDDQLFYLKYNLMNKINKIKESKKEDSYYFNFGDDRNCELFFRISKKFNQFCIDGYNSYIYNFNTFKQEKMKDIDDIYVNSVLALLPVYNILNTIQINDNFKMYDIILKFIKTHINEDFNNPEIHLLVLKLFTSMKKVENKLKRLESNLNSPKYNTMIEIIMNNWKHVIKDKNILNINEIFKIPSDKRISIEILVNN